MIGGPGTAVLGLAAVLGLLAAAFPGGADTGVSVSASLHILGEPSGVVAGGASGYSGHCPLPLPALGAALWLRASGDTVEVSSVVRNDGPSAVTGALFTLALPPWLEPRPGTLELSQGEAVWGELGGFRVLLARLGTLPPGRRIRVSFRTSFSRSGTLVLQGLVLGDNSPALPSDAGDTVALGDPDVVALGGVAGGMAAAFPFSFSKGASPRLAFPGGRVRFSLRFRNTAGRKETVEILDPVDPHFEVVPSSLTPGARLWSLGGVKFVYSSADLPPGGEAELAYMAIVRDLPPGVAFSATRALALVRGEILYSDDPGTPFPGDSTAVLFPWSCPREGVTRTKARGPGIMPVLVRGPERAVVRWVIYGAVPEGVSWPHLLLVGRLWPARGFGIHCEGEGLYIQEQPGFPLFSPVSPGGILWFGEYSPGTPPLALLWDRTVPSGEEVPWVIELEAKP